MSRRLSQTAFGWAVGLGAPLLLPGHRSMSLALAGMLSLAGALCGEWIAERMMPADAIATGGFAVSALGALATLLIYGVAMQ